jgi:hypothetical protein
LGARWFLREEASEYLLETLATTVKREMGNAEDENIKYF